MAIRKSLSSEEGRSTQKACYLRDLLNSLGNENILIDVTQIFETIPYIQFNKPMLDDQAKTVGPMFLLPCAWASTLVWDSCQSKDHFLQSLSLVFGSSSLAIQFQAQVVLFFLGRMWWKWLWTSVLPHDQNLCLWYNLEEIIRETPNEGYFVNCLASTPQNMRDQ